jgi:hypothetical protein
MQLFLVKSPGMTNPAHRSFTEFFAVIGGENDNGTPVESQVPESLKKASDMMVGEADL